MEENNLKIFKEKYDFFKQKYNLPDFHELNMLFEIEDLDVSETDFLLRKIRKVIVDKLLGYLRFIEMILTPSNAPLFFFDLVKKLDSEDTKILNKLYKDVGKLEIDIVSLDLDYNESNEAEFIKNIYDKFFDIKSKILPILDKMKNGSGFFEDNSLQSYCG